MRKFARFRVSAKRVRVEVRPPSPRALAAGHHASVSREVAVMFFWRRVRLRLVSRVDRGGGSAAESAGWAREGRDSRAAVFLPNRCIWGPLAASLGVPQRARVRAERQQRRRTTQAPPMLAWARNLHRGQRRPKQGDIHVGAMHAQRPWLGETIQAAALTEYKSAPRAICCPSNWSPCGF